MKPLKHKAYGRVPHLKGSRLGSGDHYISEEQGNIAIKKTRDTRDVVICQEKLDGSNMAVAKINGEILALGRAGYLATSSPYKQHKLFDLWVMQNRARFDELLNEGERVCGEWLAMAHSTRYNLTHEPFVPFDLITGFRRSLYEEFEARVRKYDFVAPRVLNIGSAFSIESMLKEIKTSGHGALDEVEGAVWRVERDGEVDFLAKYVRHDKEDGKYFAEKTGKEIWNIDVNELYHNWA